MKIVSALLQRARILTPGSVRVSLTLARAPPIHLAGPLLHRVEPFIIFRSLPVIRRRRIALMVNTAVLANATASGSTVHMERWLISQMMYDVAVRALVSRAINEDCLPLNVLRVHVPPVGTPRRFQAPQPLPREGRLAEMAQLPVGPTGGAASAPPVARRSEVGDRARLDRRQPRRAGRLAAVLQLPLCTAPERTSAGEAASRLACSTARLFTSAPAAVRNCIVQHREAASQVVRLG